MGAAKATRARFSERINTMLAADRPLRELAGNMSKIAKYAIDEANSLSLEHVEITLERLPKKLDGFRIIHLSDIHHSPFTSLDHITRAVNVANRLRPDMFVLTGDYVSHEPEYIGPVAEVLGTLEAEFGTHACLGNHDHWTDPGTVSGELSANGINVLLNEGFRFEARGAAFWLAGVDDHMVGRTDLPAAMKGAFPDEMKLLLAHNPIIFRKAVRYGIDLTLSGHTHGGQICLPGGRPITLSAVLPRKFGAGPWRHHNMIGYTAVGAGSSVVPVRFNCPPEITLHELRRSNEGQ